MKISKKMTKNIFSNASKKDIIEYMDKINVDTMITKKVFKNLRDRIYDLYDCESDSDENNECIHPVSDMMKRLFLDLINEYSDENNEIKYYKPIGFYDNNDDKWNLCIEAKNDIDASFKFLLFRGDQLTGITEHGGHDFFEELFFDINDLSKDFKFRDIIIEVYKYECSEDQDSYFRKLEEKPYIRFFY